MRLISILCFFSIVVSRCDNSPKAPPKKRFKIFDFSYNDVFSTCFSIKFTQSDTVFIRQHFAPFFSDTPKSNTTYYALLRNIDKRNLDSFIDHTRFSDFDTLYYQPYVDGVDFQLYFENDTIKNTIRVHSDSVPDQLNTFMYWTIKRIKTLQLHEIDTIINFESTKNFLVPEVTLPSGKFKPPKLGS